MEEMNYDIAIVGAGPAGLACALRARQIARAKGAESSICVLEKGAEVGAHILSGAIIDPRALDELLPQWRTAADMPELVSVTDDRFHLLTSETGHLKVPHGLLPPSVNNAGCVVGSLGAVCRWLGAQAEAADIDIFPGYAAADFVYAEDGAVAGVVTGAMGIAANGNEKPGFEPGVRILARQTILAEGSRGHLGRRAIERFRLGDHCDPQHYAIGLKEIWELPYAATTPGRVLHGAGWPLTNQASGGFFLYHYGNGTVGVGLVVDLNYRNPWLAPFAEFQRLKTHPLIKAELDGGKRIGYGARAITKGGWHSLPTMSMPGALLIGCDAGTLNGGRIKGTHTAMKSGMVAAEVVVDALLGNAPDGAQLAEFDSRFKASWAGRELRSTANFNAALHRFGSIAGGAFNYIEQRLLGGHSPLALRDPRPDHAGMTEAAHSARIDYPTPDNALTFDRLSSVFLSGTNHEEDQPGHLHLADPARAISEGLPRFAAPEQRYCPAAVYEIVTDDAVAPVLRINAQNCLHCKTCDIKDPSGNITWVPPEGGGGPMYTNM